MEQFLVPGPREIDQRLGDAPAAVARDRGHGLPHERRVLREEPMISRVGASEEIDLLLEVHHQLAPDRLVGEIGLQVLEAQEARRPPPLGVVEPAERSVPGGAKPQTGITPTGPPPKVSKGYWSR